MKYYWICIVLLISCETTQDTSQNFSKEKMKKNVETVELSDTTKTLIEKKGKDSSITQNSQNIQPSHQKENLPEVPQVEISAEPPYQKKEAKVITHYIKYDDHIRFEYHRTNYGNPDVGGSNNTTNWSFNIPISSNENSFIVKRPYMKELNFNYGLQGELYSESSTTLNSGVIKGVKNRDGNWEVTMNVRININCIPECNSENNERLLNDTYIFSAR